MDFYNLSENWTKKKKKKPYNEEPINVFNFIPQDKSPEEMDFYNLVESWAKNPFLMWKDKKAYYN